MSEKRISERKSCLCCTCSAFDKRLKHMPVIVHYRAVKASHVAAILLLSVRARPDETAPDCLGDFLRERESDCNLLSDDHRAFLEEKPACPVFGFHGLCLDFVSGERAAKENPSATIQAPAGPNAACVLVNAAFLNSVFHDFSLSLGLRLSKPTGPALVPLVAFVSFLPFSASFIPSALPPSVPVCRMPLPISRRSHQGPASRVKPEAAAAFFPSFHQEKKRTGEDFRGEATALDGGPRTARTRRKRAYGIRVRKENQWNDAGVIAAGNEAVGRLTCPVRGAGSSCLFLIRCSAFLAVVCEKATRYVRRAMQRSEARPTRGARSAPARFIPRTLKHHVSREGRLRFVARVVSGSPEGQARLVGRMPKAIGIRTPRHESQRDAAKRKGGKARSALALNRHAFELEVETGS